MALIICILAGGESKRFGRSKLQVNVDRTPLLQWLREKHSILQPDAWWLSLGPDQQHPKGAELYDRIIVDEDSHQGPLHGIAALLHAAKPGDALIVLPADMPLVKTELLQVLGNCLNLSEQQAGIMCKWALGEKAGRIEPFPSAWRGGVAQKIVDKAIAEGKGGPSQIADSPSIGKTFLHFEEDEIQFRNFNKQSDLKPLGELAGLTLTVG
jgi:molybdopterin-guanine dinucleotide biosynthesis protein A